ncbi:hypothetical protein ACEN9J_13725 [Variovorax sp. Varisp41]
MRDHDLSEKYGKPLTFSVISITARQKKFSTPSNPIRVSSEWGA